MKRLVLLFALWNMTAAIAAPGGALPVDDGAFCKSMCDSSQRECRANAQLQPKAERLASDNVAPVRNPLARVSEGAVASHGTRALGAAGDDGRRMARLGACDDALQRCTRSCAAPETSPLAAPRS